MKSFTVREYAKDMEIPEGTAWNAIIRGVRDGIFVHGPKVKINGRYYKTYAYPGELEPREFEIPATTFWNDPFNKTRKAA